MSKSRPQSGIILRYERPMTFTERLKEVARFFQGRSAVHQTMRRLVKRLKKAKIPYAVFGGMAVLEEKRREEVFEAQE